MFLSVVLPFSSRFWLLAFCFGCFCAEEKTSADSRLGFLLIYVYTAISRKVVGKMCTRQSRKVIWDMVDTRTVPDDCSCRTYFCCFPLALANTFSWPFVPILSNFFEEQ